MKKERKPGRLEELSTAIAQQYAHVHSLRVMAKRTLLQFEAEQIESEITGLSAALSSAKRRRGEIAALVHGLGTVLGKR